MTEERLAQIETELSEDVSWRDQADRSDLAWELLTALKQVRAGIAGLRREHGDVCVWCDGMEPCDGDEHCECGATKHNAAIDALLEGAP